MAGRRRRIPLRPDDPWANATWPYARWDLADLVTIGLMPFGLVFLGEVVLLGQLGQFGSGSGVLLTLTEQLGLGLGVLWWVRIRYGTVAPLGLRRRTWSGADVAVGIGIGVGAMFAGGLVIVLTQEVVRAIAGEAPAPRDVVTELGDAWQAVAIVLAVAVAPWSEEVFFRGFLFAGLRRRLRSGWAALISGFAFALIHADPIRLAGLTLMGMLLALGYERRKTLVTSIAAHTTVNVVAVLLSLLPITR